MVNINLLCIRRCPAARADGPGRRGLEYRPPVSSPTCRACRDRARLGMVREQPRLDPVADISFLGNST